MNLYLFNDNDSAATYGVGTYLKELTHALRGTAINIHIIHLHSTRLEFEIVKLNHIEYWYVPEVRNHNTFTGTIQRVENYFQNVIYILRLYIKETNNLIFHFNFNLCHELSKGLKENFNCKTVSTIHFLKWQLELYGNLSLFHSIKSKPECKRNSIEQLLNTTDEYESLFFQEVDHVIALSMHTKKQVVNEYKINSDRISIIPNGLKKTCQVSKTIRNSLRQKWHIPDSEFLILFVGRLHITKGLSFLIEAFHKVLEKIPNCRLIIVGSGSFEQYIQASKNICAKITFTGFLEKIELYEIYQIVDIGILPSLTEQCSYVVIEMMMNGLPIITTSAWGLAEMTEDSISSLHVSLIEHPDKTTIDTDLLAEKILFLLEHPDEAKRLGRNARKCYEERYSGKVFRNNMLKFYESILINSTFAHSKSSLSKMFANNG